MTRNALKATPMLAVAALLAASALLADDHHGRCSLRGAVGDSAYTTSGTRVGIGPVAGVGMFTQNADGTLTGKQTVSFNGVIAEETISGEVTVNPDCTGTATVHVASPIAPRTTTLDLVWMDDMNESFGIFTSAATIVTFSSRRVHPHHGWED